MKNILLSAVAVTMMTGAATAADMGIPYKAPVVGPLVYNWTGCYLGPQVGAIVTRDSFTSSWGNGVEAGGQIGCNYQFDHLVVGVEGEGGWANSRATIDAGIAPAVFNIAQVTGRWDADVALRFGLAYDRFFIYSKLGYGWEDFRFSAPLFTGTSTLGGVLWGLGLEYGITPQWTAKIETDVIIFGDHDVATTCVTCIPPITAVATQNLTAIQTKVGVNYRF